MSGLPFAKTVIRSFKAMKRKSGSLSFNLVRSWVTVEDVGLEGMLCAMLKADHDRVA